MSSSLHDSFQAALARHAAASLLDVARDNPRASLGEFLRLVDSMPGLGALTLGALLGGKSSSAPARALAPASKAGVGRKARSSGKPGAGKAAKGGRPAAASKTRAAKSGGTRDTRSQAGRDAFDAEVLGGVKTAGGKDVSASALRDLLGGADEFQLRAALHRLIARGKLKTKGQTRATRYYLA